MEKCKGCKRYFEDADCAECKPDYKTTKADKIRAMSDLELSNFIKSVHNDGTCREYAVSHGQAFTDMFGNKGVLPWLQSKAE